MVRNKHVPKLSTNHGLKYIAPLATKRTWGFPEPPKDLRALDALEEYDPQMHAEVLKWHRAHGRGPALAAKLSKYDRKYGKFNKLSSRHQHLWHAAERNMKSLYRIPFTVSCQSIDLYSPTKNASSGYPRYEGRKDTLVECINDGRALLRSLTDDFGKSFRSLNAPPVTAMLKAMPGPRTDEEGEPKFSTRGIWCYPAAVTTVESMFGVPLYKMLLKYADVNRFPIMHGPGAFGRARSFVGSIDVGQGLSISDHISGDTQIPPFAMRTAFRILEGMLDFSRLDDEPTTPEGEDMLRRSWAFVQWYFINTPIVFNDHLYRKSGGIPSGSLFTLLIWCILSSLYCSFVSLSVQNRTLTVNDLCVCGDDNGFRLFKKGVTAEEIRLAYKSIYVDIHPAPKSSVTYWPHCTSQYILSTRFNDPSRCHRDTVDMFSRCVYPNGWVSCREESVARVMMISMSMLNSHPRIYNFAVWYYRWKPVYLKRCVNPDRDLLKYFFYVLGKKDYFGTGRTKLIDIVTAFSNSTAMFLQFCVA